MPNFEITSPDGQKFQITAPDGATQDQVMEFARSQIGAGKSTAPAPKSATADVFQKIQSSVPMRVIQGMRDPIDAGAQMLSHAIPESVIDAIDYIPGKIRNADIPVLSDIFKRYMADPRPAAVDKAISENEGSYQAARGASAAPTLSSLVTGRADPGVDVARLAGNVVSPANAGLARVLPVGAMATLPRMASTGAATGAVGGALTPITDEKGQQDFLTTKAAQAGLGAATGAVATPLIGKAAQAITPQLERIANALTGPSEVNMARISQTVDRRVRDALRDIGVGAEDVSRAQMENLRRQVWSALTSGRDIDAAAMLRKGDFDALGLPHTQGQITRDPTQFARERNLRGVAGVGDPLQELFSRQNQTLQRGIADVASGAADRTTGSERIAEALMRTDQTRLKPPVDNAYALARDSLGRAAPMDSKSFADRANLALDEGMLGAYLPAEARTILNRVSAGEIPLNVNTAVQIDSVLSGAQRAPGIAPNARMAIGKVRDALNSTQIADNVGEDAKQLFDAARGAARQRFQLHDAIPALKAAVNGEISPSDFVRRFLINGEPRETERLAQFLRTNDPAAYQQARSQIGAAIQHAAFGENQAADKLLAPERLARTIRDIGPQKLSAFFSPSEVETIRRMARVGAYINSVPEAATVNHSNTAAAAANLLGRIPGLGLAGRVAGAVATPVTNQLAVRSAMRQTVPATSYSSPEAMRRAALISAVAGMGAGGAAGGAVGQ